MADHNGDKMDIDSPSVPPAEQEQEKQDDASKPGSSAAISDAGQSSTSQPPKQQLPESLIAGRSKRSTAGNRLAALLDREAKLDQEAQEAAQAAEEDEIALLFQENESDDEFEGKEESDIELGSSSDEEDNAGQAGNQDDELAGERELQREAKEEKAREKKRRAANDPFTGQQKMKTLFGLGGTKRQDGGAKKQKKVQIQEPHESSPADTGSPAESILEKQRKKSERISWVPTPQDQPQRQSNRKQTVANKKVTHQRLKEAEARRIKTIQTMHEAAQRKKKEKQVVWTQEMRLEEAMKIEELNKKSLNKWEELEIQRAEARQAKLEALHNRKLKGPMITFYSKAAEWEEPRKLVEEVDENSSKEASGKRRGRPRLAEKETEKTIPAEGKDKTSSDEGGQKDVAMTDRPKEGEDSKAKASESGTPKSTEASPKDSGTSPNATAEATPKDSSTNGTGEATLKDSSTNGTGEATPKDSGVAPKYSGETSLDAGGSLKEAGPSPKASEPSPKEPGEHSPSEALPPQKEAPQKEAQPTDGDIVMDDAGKAPEENPAGDKSDVKENADGSVSAQPEPSEPKDIQKADANDVGANIYIDPAEKLLAETQAAKQPPNISSRTFIILQNFDKHKIQTKEYQGKVLFPHNKGPMIRPDRPLCVVTNLPARFRDPATGLPYANLFAYKQIQRVRSGEIRWSDTLQCFVGVQTEAAAGVPEGFLLSD